MAIFSSIYKDLVAISTQYHLPFKRVNDILKYAIGDLYTIEDGKYYRVELDNAIFGKENKNIYVFYKTTNIRLTNEDIKEGYSLVNEGEYILFKGEIYSVYYIPSEPFDDSYYQEIYLIFANMIPKLSQNINNFGGIYNNLNLTKLFKHREIANLVMLASIDICYFGQNMKEIFKQDFHFMQSKIRGQKRLKEDDNRIIESAYKLATITPATNLGSLLDCDSVASQSYVLSLYQYKDDDEIKFLFTL